MNKNFREWLRRTTATLDKKAELKVVAAPTYPLRDAMSIEQARERVASDFDDLIREAEEWWLRNPPIEPADEEPFERFAREALQGEPPPVHAQRSPTGVGKTRVGAKEISADRRRRQLIQERSPLATRPWGYFGPTHRLNESTAEQFREQGLSAQVYYGRGAWDRGVPGNEDLPEDERVLMCLKPERVALAIAAHQSVPETCCHKQPRRGKGGREEKCEHFDEGSNQCGYQKQFNGGVPDVWLAPHEMLFHAHHALSELAGIIIEKFHWAFFDPRKGPVAGAWYEARGWAVALREYLWPGDIPPLGGDGKVAVDATVAPAKLPWSTPVVEEITDPETVRSILAEYADDGVNIFATLPIELRFAALCLPLPPENSRRHDGQEAA